ASHSGPQNGGFEHSVHQPRKKMQLRTRTKRLYFLAPAHRHPPPPTYLPAPLPAFPYLPDLPALYVTAYIGKLKNDAGTWPRPARCNFPLIDKLRAHAT